MSKLELTKDGRHKFKWMTYDGEKVRIDKDISNMIGMMWKLGIRTNNSCHGHCSFNCNHKVKAHPKAADGTQYFEAIWTPHCHDNVWLVFDHAKDLEKFYNYVAKYVSINEINGTMYAHMKGYYPKKNARDVWVLRFVPRNYGTYGRWIRHTRNGKRDGFEMWSEEGCKKNKFIMQPQLTFPRKHIAYVEQRLQLALDKKKK